MKGPVTICVGVLILGAGLAAPVAVAQQAVALRGRVLAADNGQPLRRALVAPVRGSDIKPAFTDDEGRFELAIGNGSRTLVISKAGYAPSLFEIARAAVGADNAIEIRLSRAAAVSGRVTRSSGAPVSGVRVVASRLDADASASASSRPLEALTDDLGEYRIGGLAAGRYQVTRQQMAPEMRQIIATISAGGPRRPPPLTPIPATVEPTDPGRAIDVRPGDEAGPIDFHVETSEVPDLPPNVVVNIDNDAGHITHVTRTDVVQQRPIGAIIGTVVDQAGDALQGIRVEPLRLQRQNGRMIVVPSGAGLARVTDDRGRYRLWGMSAGTYLIVATTDATASGIDREDGSGFTKVYYPGTPSLESAQTVMLDEAREVVGVNLTFAPSRSARVSGTAFDRSGQPLVGQVRLIATQRSTVIAVDPLVERVDWDGNFVFPTVPSGDYVLQAVGTNPGHRDEFGYDYVTVGDRDPDPVKITTSVGATLEGHFVAEGGRRMPLRFMSVHAAPSDLDHAPSEGRGPDGLAVFGDGRFSLSGLRGSMRLTPGDVPAGWYLKSVSIGGLDVTDQPFDFGLGEQTFRDAEIVLSPSGAVVDGSIEDRSATRASNVAVLAFPRSRDMWYAGSRYVKEWRGSTKGRFTLNGLPPGDYWVVAVDRLETSEWQSADVLDALVQGATRVTLAEGQTVTTSLRLFRRP